MTKQEAISVFGNTRQLADALGITVQAVHQWPETVPALRAYQIAEILARGDAA